MICYHCCLIFQNSSKNPQKKHNNESPSSFYLHQNQDSPSLLKNVIDFFQSALCNYFIQILTKLLKHKIMNQAEHDNIGPRCFGTSERYSMNYNGKMVPSFVDVRDEDIPGPGAHDPERFDKQTPPQWRIGDSTQRDRFLDKHRWPVPASNQYQINTEQIKTQGPKYSIPHQEHERPAQYRHNDMSGFDYHPHTTHSKPASQKYTFGYTQQMDYRTDVPSPTAYTLSQTQTNFNKTQHTFTTSERPLPYGEQGNNPGVGEYELQVNDPMKITGCAFGKGKRSNIVIGPDSPGIFYNISKGIKNFEKGYTMRPYYDQVRNKEAEKFPGPTKYTPKRLNTVKNIAKTTGPRSTIHDKQLVKYPNPQKHVTPSEFYKKRKSLSFTKETRYTPKPNGNPGPGNYEIARPMTVIKGYMGKKIKDIEKIAIPGVGQYDPKDSLTKPHSQRTISYKAYRTDFSKSMTGRVGPGEYEITKQSRIYLGKVSKSLKFEKNKNKNPGPGYYEIPGTIGALPRYYCGRKKITVAGYSTYSLQMKKRAVKTEKSQEQRKIKQMSTVSIQDEQHLKH